MPKRLAPVLAKLGPHAAASYEPIKLLGRGAFGTAFAVRSKASGHMMVCSPLVKNRISGCFPPELFHTSARDPYQYTYTAHSGRRHFRC
eukprot:scaffold59595_cov30-Tisochrysis_lutea.AAC.1